MVNNECFPEKVDENFFKALEKNSNIVGAGDISLPCDYNNRIDTIANHLVVTTLEYMRIVDSILFILLGIDSERSQKKTQYYKVWLKGIFSHTLGLYAVYEIQCREVLHIHIIVYGGLSAELLPKVSCFPNLCKEVASVLNGMYQVQLPQKEHILKFLQNNMKAKHVPPIMQLCPIP